MTSAPRKFTALLVTLAGLSGSGVALAAPAFGFDDVAQRARELAAQPYRKPASLPRELQELDYDHYREIRLRPEAARWRNAKTPFELTFFHLGWRFQQPVRINEVNAQGVSEIRFDPAQFDYGSNKLDPTRLKGLGFAGFRVHYPVNTPKYKDEVITFLGASYFRALGRGQRYGLSARGLAIDTALPSGEEFPRFVEFWIERPAPEAKELVMYALLDSPRATGAYRFVLTPGDETAVGVRLRLFLRDKVGKIGLAPLTSMYLFGENQRSVREDYRPEVHNSDGLSIATGPGEWLWRPLVNPRRLLVTSFAATDLHGFGLMQRDREFLHYEDVAARPELLPSAWVEPQGAWGAGRVELVQIPSPDDTNDNIVTYWVPDRGPQPGQPFDLSYTVHWQKDRETRPPHAWVVQTRRGAGFTRKSDGRISFLVDFDGPALKKFAPDSAPEAVVTHDSNAQLVERRIYRNDATGTWRLSLGVKRLDDDKPVELRAMLRDGNNVISETWSYIIPPG
jgi:glucans biosynthesis protein